MGHGEAAWWNGLHQLQGFWILHFSSWMVSHISIAVGFGCQGPEKPHVSCMWILGAWLLFDSGLSKARAQARGLPCLASSCMAVLLCSWRKACECRGFLKLWLWRWDWRWIKILERNHEYWEQFKPLWFALKWYRRAYTLLLSPHNNRGMKTFWSSTIISHGTAETLLM